MMASEQNSFAAKTLRPVEVAPASSRQHEFHANRLRKLLGFPEMRTQGRLVLLLYLKDGAEPLLEEGQFTLYDSRLGKPRKPEWRMYYKCDAVQLHAKPGDLLVLFRASVEKAEVHAVIARAGTEYERQLRQALELRDHGSIRTFVKARDRRDETNHSSQVGSRSTEWTWDTDFEVTGQLFYTQYVGKELPSTSRMATAAAELVSARFGRSLGADDYLVAALEAESQLFFALEDAAAKADIEDLITSSPSLKEILEFAMKRLQSRKSRRGRSLENHVLTMLERYGIPFTAQCLTEKGSRPDFVIPGCEQYHSPSFPADQLRMVGCKSRIRERWPQYLKEAERIPIKYHVTVDSDLTASSLRDMHTKGLRVFMPSVFIKRFYAESSARDIIGTMEMLIDELRAITVGLDTRP